MKAISTMIALATLLAGCGGAVGDHGEHVPCGPIIVDRLGCHPVCGTKMVNVCIETRSHTLRCAILDACPDAGESAL